MLEITYAALWWLMILALCYSIAAAMRNDAITSFEEWS